VNKRIFLCLILLLTCVPLVAASGAQQADASQSGTPSVQVSPEPNSAPNLRTPTTELPRKHSVLGPLFRKVRSSVKSVPWWAQVSLIAKVVLLVPTIGVVTCAGLVVSNDLDPFVAMLGIAVGLFYQTALLLILGNLLGTRLYKVPWLGRRLEHVSVIDWSRRMQTHPAAEGWITMFIARTRTASLLGAVMCRPSLRARASFILARIPAIAAWAMVSFAIALAGMMTLHFAWPHVGKIRLILAALLLTVIVRAAPMLLVTRGRHAVAGWWDRVAHHEYWPMWLFYLPLVPYLAKLALKHRSVTAFACCNAGIENAGGLIGERKHAIMAKLSHDPRCLRTVLLEAGPIAAERARAARTLMAATPGMAEFPIVIKPDTGHRGFAVRIIRSDADLLTYLESMTAAAILQPYDPGPQECSVLWSRSNSESAIPNPQAIPAGFIYSITRKEFPQITGDGEHTVEELIYAHPRFRRQVDVFLDRFPDLASQVLPRGEILRLALAGNHCQGTLFRDGADLITPGLSSAIDALARSFKGGLDIGRFDLRYVNEESLEKGDFRIVELNGTGGESTNLYDPDRSIFWAYRVLFGHWRLMYELGAQRQAAGGQTMSLLQLWSAARSHRRSRRGSPISD
jgi:hypothetical protein